MNKVLQLNDAQSTIKTGIWAGRFQFIHNGHEYVFSNILSAFDERIISIVNPNPNISADVSLPRFDKELNPLNYFQRMLLWKVLAEENKIDVLIIPSWNFRKVALFENEFLPFHCQEYPGRCWIVPVDQGENEYNKARDLQRCGEVVCDSDFSNEPEIYRSITASVTRKLYESNNLKKFNEYTPECLQSLTKIFMDSPNSEPYNYVIVPLIDDKIDFSSLQFAINRLEEDCNRYIVIAISIGVEDCDEWWFKPAKRLESKYPYYRKMLVLRNIFKQLGISKYLITPIFVKANDFGYTFPYCSAFLPLRGKSTWIINKDVNYDYNLLVSLETQNVKFIDKSTTLVDENNFDFFCVPELEPLTQITDYPLVEHTLKLHKSISDFINLHRTSDDDTELSLCAKFSGVSEQLIQLVKKLKYNVISEQQAFRIFSTIRKQWEDK